jgi:hypothetical protein
MKHVPRVKLWVAVVIAACAGFAWASPANAWGASGHRTVCEIALRNLTPVAKAEVDRLLNLHPVLAADPLNREFASACTYPDRVVSNGPQRRDSEHFVNYPRSLQAVLLESGCGTANECVDTAIVSDFALLRSRFVADRYRAAALIYLGHWIGDVHQPLHNSFEDDRGGGRVATSGLCSGGLHSTWDTCILQRRVFSNSQDPPADAVRQVAAAWSQVTDTQRAQWLGAAPWQWSQESYAIALRPEVGYCVMVQTTCRYDANREKFNGSNPRTVMVGDEYMNMATPIIQQRITQAGVRLAHLINLALDPAYAFAP